MAGVISATSEAYNGPTVTNMTKRVAEMGLEGTFYPRNKVSAF